MPSTPSRAGRRGCARRSGRRPCAAAASSAAAAAARRRSCRAAARRPRRRRPRRCESAIAKTISRPSRKAPAAAAAPIAGPTKTRAGDPGDDDRDADQRPRSAACRSSSLEVEAAQVVGVVGPAAAVRLIARSAIRACPSLCVSWLQRSDTSSRCSGMQMGRCRWGRVAKWGRVGYCGARVEAQDRGGEAPPTSSLRS